ncbi:MAG: PH domain-containing protein [Planctomycetia bacterium]|nr:PH domain-containing protein [Planctomycetia bacterium]
MADDVYLNDEKVLCVAKIAWSAIVCTLIMDGLVVLGICLATFFLVPYFSFVYLTQVLKYYGLYRVTTMVITKERVYIYGIGAKKVIPVSHILSVETSAGWVQQLLGMSDLYIHWR